MAGRKQNKAAAAPATAHPDYVRDMLAQVHSNPEEQLGKLHARKALTIKPEEDDLEQCHANARTHVYALQQTLQAGYLKTFCPVRAKKWVATQEDLDEIWLKQAQCQQESVDKQLATALVKDPRFVEERIWKVVLGCLTTHLLGCVDLADGARTASYALDIKCSTRLEKIRSIMEKYPLVRNDVLNGKGIDALVCDPDNHIKGKLANFEINKVKPKYAQKKVKDNEDAEEESELESTSTSDSSGTVMTDGQARSIQKSTATAKTSRKRKSADADLDPQPRRKAARKPKTAEAASNVPAAQPVINRQAGPETRNVYASHAVAGAPQSGFDIQYYATAGNPLSHGFRQPPHFAKAPQTGNVYQDNATAGMNLPVMDQSAQYVGHQNMQNQAGLLANNTPPQGDGAVDYIGGGVEPQLDLPQFSQEEFDAFLDSIPPESLYSEPWSLLGTDQQQYQHEAAAQSGTEAKTR